MLPLLLCLCLPSQAHVPHHVINALAAPADLSAEDPWYVIHEPYGVSVLLESPGGAATGWQAIGGDPTADELRAAVQLDDGTLVLLSDERIWWSADARSWQQQAAPDLVYGAAGGEALWLAGAQGVWTGRPDETLQLTLPDVLIVQLRSGPGGLAAVEEGGAALFLEQGGSWHELPGPGPQAISAVPDEDTVYLGDAEGGVWRWDDSGWTGCAPLPENSDDEQSYPHVTQLAASGSWLLAVPAWGGPFASDDGCQSWQDRRSPLAADFSQTTIAEAFTGLQASGDSWAIAGWDSVGVTDDAGISWHKAFIMPPGLTRGLAFSPSFQQDGLVYIGANSAGVTRTTDGLSFESMAGQMARCNVQQLAFPPDATDEQEIYALVYHELWRSADGGHSWQQLQTPHSYIHKFELFSDPQRIWAVARVDSGGTALVESQDQGESWNEVAALNDALDDATPCGATAAPDGGICVVADGPTRVVCSSPDLQSWSAVYEGEHGGPTTLLAWPAQDPYRLFLGHEGGVCWSDDDGASWTSDDPLEADAPHRLAMADDGTIVMATRSSRLLRSDDGGESWVDLDLRLPAQVYALACHPDFAQDDQLLAGSFDGLYRVRDLHSAVPSTDRWARHELVDNTSTYLRYDPGADPQPWETAVMSQVQPFEPQLSAELGLRGDTIRFLGMSDGASQVRVVVDHGEAFVIGGQISLMPSDLGGIQDLSEGFHHVTLTGISGSGLQLDAIESWYGGLDEDQGLEPQSRCDGCTASQRPAAPLLALLLGGLLAARRRRG